MKDLYSVAVIDDLPDGNLSDATRRKVRSALVNYFNIGVNEYRHPVSGPLADVVETFTRDMDVTDCGVTSNSYDDLEDATSRSQGLLVVTGRGYSARVDSIVTENRERMYIDFVTV